ncbi:uncharacterized protein LOC144151801 [Haemaphysalis longicornis]
MEVLAAWLLLFLLTLLTSCCSAAPLLHRVATPDATTTFHPSSPTPIPPTEPVASANNAGQPTAQATSPPDGRAFTESSHTVSGYDVAMLPPEEPEDTTSPSGEEDLFNVPTAASLPSNKDDVLDYELSSLKNKPADRLATVPNIPESATSAATASEEEVTRLPWESPKTMTQATEGTPRVTKVLHANEATPKHEENNSGSYHDDEGTTPVSTTVPTVTNPQQTEEKNSSFEASTADDTPKPNTTPSPIQDHSEVQSTGPLMSTVSVFADTQSAITAKAGRQPKQSRDSLLEAETSTTPKAASSEEVDVELQLENLVSTRSPAPKLSTNELAGSSVSPYDDTLPQATPEKGDDSKSSEVIIDVPFAAENSSREVSTEPTFTDSAVASFIPKEEPAEMTTAESLPRSTLEDYTVAPVLHNSDDHKDEMSSSSTTLPITESPAMGKVTSDVTTSIMTSTVPGSGVGVSDPSITEDLSVPPPMQAASTSPVPDIIATSSGAVSSDIPKGEEAQNTSYSTSTSEEVAVQMPTEAHDVSDYVSETFPTALSEDSTPSIAESPTPSSALHDLETMLTSQSSQDDVVSPDSNRNNETFQTTLSEDSTPSFSEPPASSSAPPDLETMLTSQSSQHDVVVPGRGHDTPISESESTTEPVPVQSAQNETEAIIDGHLPTAPVTVPNRNFSGDDNVYDPSGNDTSPETFTSADTSSVAEAGIVTTATTAYVTVPAFENTTGIPATTVGERESATYTGPGNEEEMLGLTVPPNENVSAQLLPELRTEHGEFWDLNETSHTGSIEVTSDAAQTSSALPDLPGLIGQVPTSIIHELTTALPSNEVALEESNNFSPSSRAPLSVTATARPTAEDVTTLPSTHSSSNKSVVSPTKSRVPLSTTLEQTVTPLVVQTQTEDGRTASTPLSILTIASDVPAISTAQLTEPPPEQVSTHKEGPSLTTTSSSIQTASSPHEAASTKGISGFHTTPSAPTKPSVERAPGCVPLEPPRRLTHEFRLVFNTSDKFAWDQVEVLERRIQQFAGDDTCPRRFARTAFALGPPHVLSWTDPSVNDSWCDRSAVDAFYHTMRTEVARAFYPEFKVVAVELRYRGACDSRRTGTSFPVVATAAIVGVLLSAALVTGLVVLLWRALRMVPSRSRKLNVTRPPSSSSAARQQPRESFDLKQRRPILLPGESRAAAATAAAVAGTNGTPSKSPHTKPNPPFVVDTDFCYINPNFLEVVKPSPPPPPYRRSLDRRVRSLEAVLPAPPPRPPHGPHSTLGNRSLGRTPERPAEHDEGNSSSSGVESDAQPSGEAKSTESS